MFFLCLRCTYLIKETVSKIQQYESRERARSAKAQQSFEYAVTAILVDLWKASFTIPASECLINKRNGYYSENRRYKHPLMTYKQTKAAFKGLMMLGYIEVTKGGYFDRPSLQGALTKFIARDELAEQLRNIDGHPAVTLPSNIDRETIVLRDIIDGERKTAFCLIEAPNKKAIQDMHDHAHGEVPHSIIEVDAAIVESFLGRIEDPNKSQKKELNIVNNPGFRILAVLKFMDSQHSTSPKKEVLEQIKSYTWESDCS